MFETTKGEWDKFPFSLNFNNYREVSNCLSGGQRLFSSSFHEA